MLAATVDAPEIRRARQSRDHGGQGRGCELAEDHEAREDPELGSVRLQTDEVVDDGTEEDGRHDEEGHLGHGLGHELFHVFVW